MDRTLFVLPALVAGSLALGKPLPAGAQGAASPHLTDRGTGVPTSLLGTYIRRGEFLIYPFYEYYHDDDLEYEPAEFGFGLAREFRGRYRADEFLLFLGYGVTDRLAIEFEAAVIDARLRKSPLDPSDQPEELAESGVGDVESQLRWRWLAERSGRPEVFSYFETVFPLQGDKVLIGTRDWEFKLGAGLIKGFRWGTLTFRSAVAYDGFERKAEFGEYALEYLKRVSSLLRLAAMVEGEEDEVELVAEAQLHLGRRAYVKLNSGFGLTSKATDFAPAVGILFSLGAPP